MYEELIIYIAFYSLFWAIVFFICMMRYSFGDRKHVHTLIRKLAKDPDWYLKDDGVMSILISGMSAGGFLVIYSFIYPLVVHRSFKRGYKIDIMMWLHWLWCMSFVFFRFYE
ncbi:hypothetical protein SBX64_06640 [Vibrio rhizosphaerae]|uniref:Uncharacterized protein n=1 Tax=Vibrio rhizosphaerae TaxID=398736 RepID=A0ABU4IS48_9VIBR|nr:hypothetical protein [Vibrio rhizosphaerae]MDW6092221.1 hypothetical protein [Vibrio rhizosphaerae]